MRSGWHRWQIICGWLALVTSAIWALKFALLASTGGQPSAAIGAFTGFLAPTSGSVLGLIAAFGVAIPLVVGWRWWLAAPVAVVSGLATVFAISALSNATTQLSFVAESPSPVVRAEASIVTTALLYAVLATWLLRPRLDSRVPIVLLAIGGVLWLAKGAAVAAGSELSGWTVGVYQGGLWALLIALLWLAARAVHAGHARYVVASVGIVVVTQVVGAVPILAGELSVLIIGGLALALAWVLRRASGDSDSVGAPSLG